MVRRLARLVATASLALGSACNCGPKDGATASAAADVPPRSSAPKGDPDVLSAIESMGNEGAWVVVLRPQQWAGVHGALMPWLSGLPNDAEPLIAAKTAEDLPGLLAYPLGIPASAVELQGWDTGRPVVASLGEVPYDGPPGSLTPTFPFLEGWMPHVRHQVIVPATDTAALVSSIAAVLEPMGKPWPAVVEGRTGARAVALQEAAVAVIPQAKTVRVVIFESSVGMDEAQRLEHVRSRLDATAASPITTPALSLATRPDVALSGWMRTWRLRPWATASGGRMLADALDAVSLDQRAMLLSRGTQITLDAERLMTDVGAEFDDMALALVVDDETLRMQGAMSLTPEGEQAVEAAYSGASQPFMLRGTQSWVDVSLLADVKAMLDAVKPPPALDGKASPGEMASLLRESGPVGLAYMMVRHPLGMLAKGRSMAAEENLPLSLEQLPTAAHFSWEGLTAGRPRGALAFQWPKDYGTTKLSGLVSQLRTDSDLASLRMETGKRGGAPTTVLGLGVEPTAAIDPSAVASGDGLLMATVHFERIKPAITAMDAQAGAAMPSGQARMRWDRRGRAVVAELVWNPAGGEVANAEVEVDASARWDSPVGAASPTEGVECLGRASAALSAGLNALTNVPREQQATVVAKALADAEQPLACAAADEATADAAVGLRRMMARLSADVLAEGLNGIAALRLLEIQCKGSNDEQICALQERFAALPRPVVPEMDLPEPCRPTYGNARAPIRLTMDAKTISVVGKPVAVADVQRALKAAIDAHREKMRLDAQKFGDELVDGVETVPRVGLVVDREVDVARLRPVLEALVAVDVRDVIIHAQSKTGDATASRVGLFARAAKTAGGAGRARPPIDRGFGGGGILGAIEAAPPAEWVTFEVGKGQVTTRSSIVPESEVLIAPSVSKLREATHGMPTSWVHPTDAATWQDVATVVAGVCPSAGLVLARPEL